MSTAEQIPAFLAAYDNLQILGRSKPDNQWDSRHWATVPYVGPRGEFKWSHYDTRLTNENKYRTQLRGLTPLKFDDGRVVLSKFGVQGGFTLYKDICDGVARVRVQDRLCTIAELHPSVNGQDYWRMWLAFCEFKRQGKTVAAGTPEPGALTDPFTTKFYHPEILRRRQEFAKYGEVNALDQDAVLRIIMGDNFDPHADDEASAPATTDDILAAGRKSKK